MVKKKNKKQQQLESKKKPDPALFPHIMDEEVKLPENQKCLPLSDWF